MTLPLIFPPSSLPKFSASGHGIRPGSDYAGVPRGKGHSRKRPKSTGAHRIVPVRWVLTSAQAADLDFWGETSLNVWTRAFTAEVANQGPGRLFWRAEWAAMPRCIPQPTPRGVMWEVIGSLVLTGDGEASAPSTGELSGEIVIPRTGSAALVLPATPLAGEIVIQRIAITPLAGLIIIRRTSTLTPLAGVVSIARTGSGKLSAGGSGTSYSLTVEEVDGSPSQVDPAKLIFPNGTITIDSDGNATFTPASSTPGGSDTHVQYNDAGAFGGEAGFTYDKTTNTLTVEKFTATGLVTTVASATGGAGLTLPHGTAPTSPVNGNLWSTTAGFYGRVNGVTVGPFAAAGGALLYWTETANTSAPNATINAAIFTPVSSGSSGSAIVSWKGASGFLAVQAPDNTATGGNLRGIRAVDFQSSRAAAAEVASGANSGLLATASSKATGTNSLAIAGSSVTASGAQALGQGTQITADGDNSVVLGAYASARGLQSFVQGSGTSTIGRRQRASVVGFTTSSFSATTRIMSTTGGNATDIILPNNSVFAFTLRMVIYAGSDYWDMEIKATCYRGANAASTVINGVTTAITGTDIQKTTGVAGLGWALDVIADTTNGGISPRAKGDTGQIVNADFYIDMLQLTS